jgi:hypothetical protein
MEPSELTGGGAERRGVKKVSAAVPEKESSQNRAGGVSEGKAPFRRLEYLGLCLKVAVPRRVMARDRFPLRQVVAE